MNGITITFILLLTSEILATDDGLVSFLKEVKPRLKEDPDLLCTVCKMTVAAVQEYFLHDTELYSNGVEEVTEICELVIEKPVCDNMISAYAEVLVPIFGNKFLNPEFACSKMMMCDTPLSIKKNVTDVVEEIMRDVPKAQPARKTGKETFKFIHVSDIHIDLEYDPGSNTKCSYPLCCRNELGTTNNTSNQAGFWGSDSNCDIPTQTVEAFLKQTSEMDIDFVLWTGDNPAHNIWEYSRETQLQCPEVLTALFKKYFKDIPVYPIMGNHAGFPEDQYHYGHEDWLLKGLTDMWSQWYTPEAQATHLDNAYWSMKDKATDLRIIAINTQMCDTMNFWLILTGPDPANHLDWLRQELVKAEENGEDVFIIGHIPIGDQFCQSTWAVVYRALVNRFQHIIKGQFFAHTHVDHFELVQSLRANEPPVGVLYMVPSLTTFSSHAPAFRVFEIDKTSHEIVNFYNYNLDLERANKDTYTMPEFELSYDALSEYGMKDLSPASWQGVSDAILNDTTVAFKYWKHYKNVVSRLRSCNGKD